jgi:nucleotide-binding universal stress UspA family protein
LFPAHASDPLILTETAAPDVVDEVIEHSRTKLFGLVNDKDIKVHPLFAKDNIEAVFTRWIEENGIDLIVIGTHGRRGVSRVLLGSTAEYIYRHANVPVLTVGPHVTLRPYKGFEADNILFPTDLGPHAEFGAGYALSFAHETNARLTFLHVVTLEEAFQRDRTELVNASFNKLKELVPSDAKEWCKPELHVEVGDPPLEVIGFARKERPDLMVLGLPFEKKFNGHFLSGVTYKVVTEAPCPVLTVRDNVNRN